MADRDWMKQALRGRNYGSEDLVTLAAGPHLTPAERRKLMTPAKNPKKSGHIAPPGTGPAGETCGTCFHCTPNVMRSGRTYYKCGLNAAKWTGGYGSDIRKRDFACREWRALR